MVLPQGTYRLKGSVVNEGRAVPDAEVAVVAGPAAGLATTTTGVGGYRLYGVSGDTEIRVRKPGYVEQSKKVTVTSHQDLHFQLELAAPRENVDGRWTLTVRAAPACAGKLPPEILERRYSAVLTQAGAKVTARLEGPAFYTRGTWTQNTFTGIIEAERLIFTLTPSFFYYTYDTIPAVFEEIAPGQFFSMSGTAEMTGEGSRRSGRLKGTIEIRGAPPQVTPTASCPSDDHVFELTR